MKNRKPPGISVALTEKFLRNIELVNVEWHHHLESVVSYRDGGLLHFGAVCALFPLRNFQYGIVAMDQLSGHQNPLILHLVIFPHGL
jgi:hypothetical protein